VATPPALRQMFVYNELMSAQWAALVYPGGGGAIEARDTYAGRAQACEAVSLGLFGARGFAPRVAVTRPTRLVERR
jgi:hypothetical protein